MSGIRQILPACSGAGRIGDESNEVKVDLLRNVCVRSLLCVSGVVGLFLIALCAAVASAKDLRSDVICPGGRWLDNRGKQIQAHGGSVIRFNNSFYWFGEDRSVTNNPKKRYVACYSSKDLVHWRYRNQVLSISDPEHLGPGWILERPRIFFNQKTGKFVMYAHIDNASYSFARVAVAVSSKIDGDYKYVRSFRPLGQESRDIGQFVDDDGSAYLIFESRPTGGLFIAKLSDDYMNVEKEKAFIKVPLEGNAIVHYEGLYYMVGSHLTGWNPNPNVVATASDLAGPWSTTRDIAPPETNTYNSQSDMLFKVVGRQGTVVIYVGDRWNSKALWDSRYVWVPVRIGNGDFSLLQPQDWGIDVENGRTTRAP